MNVLQPQDLISRDTYPLDDLSSEKRSAVITDVKRQLNEDGCAVLRGFFTDDGCATLLAEAEQRLATTYYSQNKQCNVYLGSGNNEHSSNHPQNRFIERTNGFIRSDEFGKETHSYRLYYWPPLKQFMADCLGKDELHIYEDPISNMIVNVAAPGEQFNWHFDTNEFTITMLLRGANQGGIFEYVPNLRSKNNECCDDVNKVLDGDRSRVRQLHLEAGDLQIFLGRFSLHRVTPNNGDTTRLLLIMSFSEKSGVIGNSTRVKDLYGKITDAHKQTQVRADQLLD